MQNVMDKKTILIVEDEVSMLQTLADAIATAGFSARQATDGKQGLEIALKIHPDLIMLDILMPKMDGMEMMKNLRKDVWGRKVPVILLTNLNPDSDKTIQEVIENQPAYYLIKSDIRLEGIVEKIKEVLKMN